MHISSEAVLAAVTTGAATTALTAVARHMPDWPLSWAKMWGWFKDSVQEYASQKQH